VQAAARVLLHSPNSNSKTQARKDEEGEKGGQQCQPGWTESGTPFSHRCCCACGDGSGVPFSFHARLIIDIVNVALQFLAFAGNCCALFMSANKSGAATQPGAFAPPPPPTGLSTRFAHEIWVHSSPSIAPFFIHLDLSVHSSESGWSLACLNLVHSFRPIK
jgi:hypothetical protein